MEEEQTVELVDFRDDDCLEIRSQAKRLPEGYVWVSWGDGSGRLLHPDGSSSFGYDRHVTEHGRESPLRKLWEYVKEEAISTLVRYRYTTSLLVMRVTVWQICFPKSKVRTAESIR